MKLILIIFWFFKDEYENKVKSWIKGILKIRLIKGKNKFLSSSTRLEKNLINFIWKSIKTQTAPI